MTKPIIEGVLGLPSGYAPVASARHAHNPHVMPHNPQLMSTIRMSLPSSQSELIFASDPRLQDLLRRINRPTAKLDPDGAR